MGELLFWVGEDKMLFGSDYGIWTPKWQIEGLVDWDYPDETFSDYPRWTTAAKKKVLGLNAARLYGIEVPAGLELPPDAGTPAAKGRTPSSSRAPRRPMTLQAQALAALATVYDPELDEPITALGFVGSCVATAAGDVDVHLRLPTPQCAPNFAYLMVSDARDAVCRVPEVGEVTVVLEDHYTGDEINAAVGSGSGFDGAFPGESSGDLAALRELFQRKALLARQGRVHDALVAVGANPAAVADLRVADLPDDPDARRCVELRRELGLPHGPSDAALVAGDGSPLAAEDLGRWARRARLVGLSLESNGGLCRSLAARALRRARPTENENANDRGVAA